MTTNLHVDNDPEEGGYTVHEKSKYKRIKKYL